MPIHAFFSPPKFRNRILPTVNQHPLKLRDRGPTERCPGRDEMVHYSFQELEDGLNLPADAVEVSPKVIGKVMMLGIAKVGPLGCGLSSTVGLQLRGCDSLPPWDSITVVDPCWQN